MARTFITIADSQIGRDVLNRLAMIGVDLQAGILDHHNLDSSLEIPHLKTISLNLSKSEIIKNELEEIDRLILLVPCEPDLDKKVDSLLAIAKKKNVKHIIFLSLFGVKSQPVSHIANWYQSAEQRIINSGIPYTIVRSNFPMQCLIDYIEPDGSLNLPLCDSQISFIDKRDIAIALSEISLSSTKHFQQIYDLTGLETHTLSNISEIFTDVIGREIKYQNIDHQKTGDVLHSRKTPDFLLDPIVNYFKFLKTGNAATISNDYEVITNSLPVTIIDFARDYADSIRDRFTRDTKTIDSLWFI